MIVLYAVNLLLSANKHGQKKDGEYSFWWSLAGVIISAVLLYYGGFFESLKA